MLPQIQYRKHDFTQVRAELAAIDEAVDHTHPIGRYLHLTSESWRIATRMLDAVGTHRVTAYSTRLFGRPVEMLPGNGPTNLEAAKHFADLADELDQELRGYEPAYVVSAEQIQVELQEQVDEFFGKGTVSRRARSGPDRQGRRQRRPASACAPTPASPTTIATSC